MRTIFNQLRLKSIVMKLPCLCKNSVNTVNQIYPTMYFNI